MKHFIAIVFIFSAYSLAAQTKLAISKSSKSIKPDIEKVVEDYFENFVNIKGDTIMETTSTIEYYSNVIPEGALEATITNYKTPKTFSWQCTMFKSEEFKEAVAKYKQYFRQLNGSTFTFSDRTSYRVSGDYDTPDEGRKFASSILKASSYNANLKLFKVEVAINYAFPEWVVGIMIYEKIDDGDIRPSSNFAR